MKSCVVRAVALLGVLFLTEVASAQPRGVEQARLHYERGTAYYNLNFFPEAIKEFQAAYLAKPDPAILFNIAQANRQAGNPAEALTFYKNYLRTAKDAPNRAEVEKRIAELEKVVAQPTRAPAASSAPPVPSPATGAAMGPAPDLSVEPPPSRAYFGTAQAPPPESVASPARAPGAAGPARAELAGVDFTIPGQPPPTVAAAPAPPAPAPQAPLYKRWWFWTAIGVVVVGGVVAGYAFRPQDPKCPGDALRCR